MPSVIEQTSRGVERITDIFSRLLSDRIVFLGYPIDSTVANLIIAQLLHLEGEDPKGHQPLRQQPRRHRPGGLGDLRHHAVHQA